MRTLAVAAMAVCLVIGVPLSLFVAAVIGLGLYNYLSYRT